MKYIPVRCELHGWLLLDAESVESRENLLIECEGHMITRDTRGMALIETTERLPKTRGLTDAEFKARPASARNSGKVGEAGDRRSNGKISRLLEPTL
jgi:hypothetical protein